MPAAAGLAAFTVGLLGAVGFAGAVLSFCASAGPLPARFALLASAAASLAFFAFIAMARSYSLWARASACSRSAACSFFLHPGHAMYHRLRWSERT